MKYVSRLVWYIASRLLIICCVLGLMTTAFYYAMNASNIYIIIKDGMAKRAQVVMMDQDEAILKNYFSVNYLERDEVLVASRNGTDAYRYYDITGIDHRISMTGMWCWPWEDTARATIVETIPGIDGKLRNATKEEALLVGLTSAPPKWKSGRYQVVLTRENGQWHIKNLTLLEVITDE